MPVSPLLPATLLGMVTRRAWKPVNERKPRVERYVSYCRDQMNILQPFAETTLKNVSTEPPESDGGSTDIEK